MMREYVVVLLGGSIGALLRHMVNRAALVIFGASFPVGTMAVNIVGSLIMGLLAGWFGLRGESSNPMLRLFLTTGVLGGFTTFSTFSLDAVVLWERGQIALTALYVAASLILSIAGVLAGLTIVRATLS